MTQPKSNDEIVEVFIEKFGDNIIANTPWGVQKVEDEIRDCLGKLLAQKDAEVAEAVKAERERIINLPAYKSLVELASPYAEILSESKRNTHFCIVTHQLQKSLTHPTKQTED